MYTIIGADGREYGPVPADKVRDWIAAGRANAQTRIKPVGSTEWTYVGALPEFASGTPAAAAPAVGTVVPVATAAPAPLTGDAKTIADDLIARAAPLDVFSCIGRSFDLWKANLLPLVGVTFVVIVIVAVLGAIPLLGAIANLVLTGVFYGGLYYYYLGKIRGEPREFGDAFAGFSRNFGGLALANLLVVGISIAVALVFFAPWFIAIFVSASRGTEPNPLIFLGMFISALPLIYLSVSWTFAFALVIDRGLGPWTAVEVSRRVVTKYWFRVFFVMFLSSILAGLGLIGLVIGIFFTLPLFFGAVMYAYEDLCNPPAAAPTA